jgi:hypothetical protein
MAIRHLLSDRYEQEMFQVITAELCLPPAFTLLSCSAYSSTMKMEAMCSSETSVDFQRAIRRYIPKDRTLHNHRCENLKSYIVGLIFNCGSLNHAVSNSDYV